MIDGQLEKPLIRIDSEVTRRVRQHARAHMQTEVCGVLVGKMCAGIIEIEAPIEAFTAAQAGAHVTFTQAAWETIYKVKDEEYPEDRIVGWYHSHPGFGVFLSDYDTFIHSNFFSSPDQVAWVYDPHSDEEGCFGWVDGAIHRIANIYVADNSGESLQRPNQPAPPSQRQVGAYRRQQLLPTRKELPSPAPRKGPGFTSGFARTLSKSCSTGFAIGRSLFFSILGISRQLLRIHERQPQSNLPGLQETVSHASAVESSEAIRQLRSESGK